MVTQGLVTHGQTSSAEQVIIIAFASYDTLSTYKTVVLTLNYIYIQ